MISQRLLPALALVALHGALAQNEPGSWKSILRDVAGKPVAAAAVELRNGGVALRCTTDGGGAFELREMAAGRYTLLVEWQGAKWAGVMPVEIGAGVRRSELLRLTEDGHVRMEAGAPGAATATGGEQLSGGQVSALPLNKRDFSQLLLLAAGTQTDTNGAANFTQQLTTNGQRGTATVFAMDGIDTTDPEMGGATFSNFNVDAIQEIQSSSGAMPAAIGHGAAGFTQILSKSGVNQLHGSLFEFVRNAAFDARNFFDRQSVAQPRRIPAFSRNEFGFASGGPLRPNRTFYFVQYQGFRQVLGTTQVLPVPSVSERQGRDATAFPGDVLNVPVDPRISAVLARYPQPNDPGGPYGDRTYATSSKVRTTTDQFSVRVDHRISAKAQLFARFNLNNVEGPTTNPSQTAIDRSFAIPFFDHQRNFGVTYTRTPSAGFTWEASLGYIRSTPNFPTQNHTQPALNFADGLYEAFNAPAGSVIGAYGNLFQWRQNFTLVRGAHTWKAGVELRVNRDSTIFGLTPNGSYTFGGGAAYSPVEIRSQSGLHNIHVGDLLPDALSGFLTASPFSYTSTAAPSLFAQGERMGNSAIRRNAYNFYLQDNWKISPRVSVAYGLRYEVNSMISEAKLRTSGLVFENAAGQPVDAETAGARPRFLINQQPPYPTDWKGWGPRVGVDWRWDDKTVFRAGGTITTLLTNLWQCNFVTGGMPYVVTPFTTAAPGRPIPFLNSVPSIAIPPVYATNGQLVYASGRSTDVPANTEMDVLRFERDLAALSTDKQVRPLAAQGMARDFRNGYIGTYTAGVERSVGDVTVSAGYVATVGIKLAEIGYPNSYVGADPAFAPYTAYGPIVVMTNRSHSTYHSLQASVGKSSLRAGLGFQASYTFSKSLDDTSSVLGGFVSGASGTVLQTSPQNPRDLRGEKGPSTFDVTHAFSLSAIQQLPVERIAVLRARGKRWSTGWQLLGLASLASGAPFTVYSGIQQTGAGSNGADRPDQTGRPEFSTSRQIREDYFGRGVNNPSYFSIPIGVAGGTGPNSGRFGTLGRNSFRGPGFRNVDVALVKDTPVGRASNAERVMLQFRAEFFNIFNLVNFGLPANTVLGPGFGMISRTAGTSRQIQLSLKLLY
jgi:TonB dependent receptor